MHLIYYVTAAQFKGRSGFQPWGRELKLSKMWKGVDRSTRPRKGKKRTQTYGKYMSRSRSHARARRPRAYQNRSHCTRTRRPGSFVIWDEGPAPSAYTQHDMPLEANTRALRTVRAIPQKPEPGAHVPVQLLGVQAAPLRHNDMRSLSKTQVPRRPLTGPMQNHLISKAPAAAHDGSKAAALGARTPARSRTQHAARASGPNIRAFDRDRAPIPYSCS